MCMLAATQKKRYVAPSLNMLIIRAEERFTVSSGGCDIDNRHGDCPDIIVKDLASDTLLLNSGMSVLSQGSPLLYKLS